MSALNHDNYLMFTYTNESLMEKAPIGICIEFHGLNLTGPYAEPEERGKKFADRGIILVRPMTNPWSWMNPQALDITERIVEILGEKYPGVEKNLCVAGGSMGGYEALMFSAKSKYALKSVTVNCPLCDTERFKLDDPWRAKTIECAYYEEGDFAKSLHDHSPINCIDKMQKVPYYVYQCAMDQIINKERQADAFVEKAKGILDIQYYISETGEHCELIPELWEKYDGFIFESLEK